MLSEIHLSPKDTFHREEVPGMVSFTGDRERTAGTGAGGKMGVGVSQGQRFSLGKWKVLGAILGMAVQCECASDH